MNLSVFSGELQAFYNSGFRVSELTRIRIKNCSVTNDSLAITIIRKRGKEITIQNAFPVRLYQEVLKTFHSGFISPKEFLFKNSRSINGFYSRQFLWKEINKYSKRILGKPYSVHGCRHAHASSLLLLAGATRVSATLCK
ncbi:tyrosine-type recombinase/integrase [Leptospira sp. WS92.C1]